MKAYAVEYPAYGQHRTSNELRLRGIHTPALTEFIAAHLDITVDDFNGHVFHPVKLAVKADLNTDQGGLCVYCESFLCGNKGQLEHIKPKGGADVHPALCFTYTNYAHSCINPKTCDQKSKHVMGPAYFMLLPTGQTSNRLDIAICGQIPISVTTRARLNRQKPILALTRIQPSSMLVKVG